MPNRPLPNRRAGCGAAGLPVGVALLACASAAAEAPAGGERFGDWALACAGTCIEAALRGEGGAGEVVLRLRYLPDPSAPLLLAETPLPLRLPDGATLAFGASEPRAVPWFTCTPEGCEARLAADPALLARLRGEREASVAFTLLDGSRVRLPVSLMGFTAAERALAEAGAGGEDQVNEGP